MALTNLISKFSGANLIYGTGDVNVMSKSTQSKFGSRVEIVNGNGVIDDIIYSGEETNITETKIANHRDAIGNGELGDDGVVIRSSIKFSNEDVSKVETERLKIKLT